MTRTEAAKLPVRVGVIGAGYWGKNLVRNFHSLGALESVCDTNDETLERVRKEYRVATSKDYDAILREPGIHGVVVAAPAAAHFDLVRRALRARKHVFVEKPLALNAAEGRELVELAKVQGLVLMVGHILEYHPAITELTRLIQQGHLEKFSTFILRA